MKQAKKEMSNLEALELELKLVEDEIKTLEEKQDQKNTCYMGGKSYPMDQVYGYAADSHERYSHSFSLMMTEADKNEIRLDNLKKTRKSLMQQIEEEKAKDAMGFGG